MNNLFLDQSMAINCNGKLLDLSSPKVMQIINLTEDSFYEGSRVGEKQLLTSVDVALVAGASIIDLGAMSTRPGAKEVELSIELERIVLAVRILRKHFPNCIISIDTYRAAVIEAALEEGADMLNDISGGLFDPDLAKVFKSHPHVPYVLMHNRAKSDVMQKHTQYDDVALDVFDALVARLREIKNWGVTDIILDPGIGFSKNIDQNFTLLRKLSLFRTLNLPLLVGLSRKSLIYKTLDISPAEALNGTTALHMYALLQGAQILRVHDAKAAMECVTLYDKLENYN